MPLNIFYLSSSFSFTELPPCTFFFHVLSWKYSSNPFRRSNELTQYLHTYCQVLQKRDKRGREEKIECPFLGFLREKSLLNSRRGLRAVSYLGKGMSFCCPEYGTCILQRDRIENIYFFYLFPLAFSIG